MPSTKKRIFIFETCPLQKYINLFWFSVFCVFLLHYMFSPFYFKFNKHMTAITSQLRRHLVAIIYLDHNLYLLFFYFKINLLLCQKLKNSVYLASIWTGICNENQAFNIILKFKSYKVLLSFHCTLKFMWPQELTPT